MPPRPPGSARRSSSQRRAASTARLWSGRGEKRSQILRPSSTAMKKFFQKSERHVNGSGTRGKRRLAFSRGTGHSSSSEKWDGSHLTGLRSMTTRSGTMTVRDQYETSYRLKKNQGGDSMISTGMAGTPFQSYSPNSASWI